MFCKTTHMTWQESSETPQMWVVEWNTECIIDRGQLATKHTGCTQIYWGKTTAVCGKSHSNDAIVNKVLDSCITTLTKKAINSDRFISLNHLIFLYIVWIGFIFYQWYPRNSCPVHLFDIQLCHWKRNCTYFQMAANQFTVSYELLITWMVCIGTLSRAFPYPQGKRCEWRSTKIDWIPTGWRKTLTKYVNTS